MRFCLRCDNVRWMGRVVDAREGEGRSTTDERLRRSSGHGALPASGAITGLTMGRASAHLC